MWRPARTVALGGFRLNTGTTLRTSVGFGDRSIEIAVLGHATVVEFDDPGALPHPTVAAREAIEKPCGAPPLKELAKPGMRVAVGFDAPTRPARTVQIILPVVVDALLEAGVAASDITFVCACSNHRKWTRRELAAYLGPEIFSRFGDGGQVVNHDCSDRTELEFLGFSPAGRYPLEMNRRFVSADLMIYVGNVGPGGFRTYTGTGAVIGLASTRSIASHHSLHGIRGPGHAAGEASRKSRHSVKDDLNTQLECTDSGSCIRAGTRASVVIMAGSRNPGAFRALGITPAADFAEAWRLATRIVGPDPVTVVAPNFWSRKALNPTSTVWESHVR